MRIAAILIGLCLSACSNQPSEPVDGGKTYHVYFLGGQSNMEGYGLVSDLSGELADRHEDIPIFMGNMQPDGKSSGGRGFWAPLEPGFARNFTSTGKRNKLTDSFGPEITFALEMQKLYPDQNIALIKYTRGGSSLAYDAPNYGTWTPAHAEKKRPNQYDFALRTIKTALSTADIDGDEKRDILIPAGLVWMQGEADAINEGPALVYEDNLREMMTLLKEALQEPSMPVVIGKITDSGMDEDGLVMDHIALVQAAQARFVASETCAAYVTEIDEYEHSEDAWHYKSDGYLRMGRAFAKAMSDLSQQCGVDSGVAP